MCSKVRIDCPAILTIGQALGEMINRSFSHAVCNMKFHLKPVARVGTKFIEHPIQSIRRAEHILNDK